MDSQMTAELEEQRLRPDWEVAGGAPPPHPLPGRGGAAPGGAPEPPPGLEARFPPGLRAKLFFSFLSFKGCFTVVVTRLLTRCCKSWFTLRFSDFQS